jgi:dTDP-4-dehydrorhamnose reductase
VPLVHISTDYVFGDAPGPFAEDAAGGPVQHYGESKRRGELAVLAAGGRAVVVRGSWLFGRTSSAFSDYVLGQVDGSGSPVRVHTRQQSRPSALHALAPWILAVAARLADGEAVPTILHPAGGPCATRREWALAILDAAGHAAIPIVDQGEDGRMRAPRPLDSRLDGTMTSAWSEECGLPSLGDWRVHLGSCGS